MTVQESEAPATPEEIAASYKSIFRNHAPEDIHLTFAEYASHVALEEITREEISDIEYMCDRVDLWLDNLGRPSAYNQN